MMDSDLFQQASEIFLEARRLGPEERGALLVRRCGENAALREQVEILLAADQGPDPFDTLADELRGIREELPLTPSAPWTQPTVSLPGRSRKAAVVEGPGTHIGRYKLLQLIGEGGFGSVFMAEQEKPVRRRVALKIIKLGMDTRQVVARFEAERQALAMMDHPSVAKVFDGGATDTGRPYFVMELVKGTPITEYCDKNNLSIPKRLELFAQVCQAVQHAHQKGLIHRDIKPSNVLVTTQDDRPVVKVIDFGIAKAIQARLTEKTLFTDFRQMIGTPEYMSPEQAEGDLDIDTRCDVYSLGVLLYELLAGSPPFDARELRSKAFAEMQRIIREVEPPAPSTRLSTIKDTLPSVAAHRAVEPRKLQVMVRGELDWVVMRCLEKDRNRRYQTANALAEDIQHYLTDEPVQARPPTRTYRMKKFIRRNKAGVLAGSAIVAALILGLALASIGFVRAHHEAIRADREAKNARTQAARSEQVAQFLKDMLKGVGPSVALGRDTTMLREILDKTAERIDKDLKDQPEVQIELRLTLAAIYHELGLFNRMEEMARGTLALARSILGEENLAVADALGQLGDALHHLPRSDEAETINRQTVAMQRKLRGSGSLQEAAALYHLSYVLNNFQRKFAEAESVSRAALAIRRKLLGNEHQDVARSLDNLSFVLASEKKLVEAEAAAREALAIRRKLFGDQHPELGRSLKALGDVLKQEGKYAEAEELYRQLLPGTRKTMGDHHPLVGGYYSGFADVLNDPKRRGESAQALQEAIAVLKRAMADSPDQRQSFLQPQAHNHRLLGYQYWGERNYSGARELFSIATDLFRQSAEAGRPTDIATALQGEADDLLCIGQLWEAESRNAEANEAYRQALALHERIEKEDRAQDITVGWIPNHYFQLAQLVEKVATREDALPIAQILHAPNRESSVDVLRGLLDCQFQLATLLQRHGSTQEAIQQLQKLSAKLPADDYSLLRSELNLASILRQGGSLAEASQVCLQAARKSHDVIPQYEKLAADPSRHQDCWSFAIAYEQLAQLLNELGQHQEAENGYRDCQIIWVRLVAGSNIEDDRWHLAVNHDVLGHLLRDTGRLDEAAGSYQKALAIWEKLAAETNNEDRHLHLSWTRGSLRDVLLRRANQAEKDTTLSEADRKAAAQACRDKAEAVFRDAEEACNQAIRKQPSSADLRKTLARLLKSEGRLADAVAAYGEAIRLQPDMLEARRELGSCHMDMGDFAKALEDFSELIRLKPDVSWYWCDRGFAYLRLGQYEKSIADLSKAIGMLDAVTERIMRGEAYRALGQWQKAETDFSKAIEFRPDWDSWQRRGQLYAELGQWDKATADLSQAARTAPGITFSYYLALVCLAREDQGGYRQTCATLLERAAQNSDPDSAFWIAWTCVLAPDAGVDAARVIQLAEQAVASDPKRSDFLAALGAALYRAGRSDEAVKRIAESEAAFAHTPGGGTVAYTRLFLAMAYQQLDNHPEAQRWLDVAKRATTQPASATKPTTTQQQPVAERWNRRVTLQLLRREAERVLTAKKGEVGHQEPTSRSGTTQPQ